ncbi:MAG: FHA domain-containing protein [Myxococcales bacterium]|nr:FHA domain-containing protein [Myxococcales bacterium]
MRFRLRYLQHDLELNEGTFAVGRNASCQLSLDDPLVSRRHALFEVGPGGVTVEDLNSRNGVIVNSHRIEGKVAISVGDRILIGSQELTLLAARDPQNSGGIGLGKMTLPKMRVTTPSSGVPVMHVESDPEPSMVRRADQFKLLSGVAEKALAMGKAGEAERLLASALSAPSWRRRPVRAAGRTTSSNSIKRRSDRAPRTSSTSSTTRCARSLLST